MKFLIIPALWSSPTGSLKLDDIKRAEGYFTPKLSTLYQPFNPPKHIQSYYFRPNKNREQVL